VGECPFLDAQRVSPPTFPRPGSLFFRILRPTTPSSTVRPAGSPTAKIQPVWLNPQKSPTGVSTLVDYGFVQSTRARNPTPNQTQRTVNHAPSTGGAAA